MVDSDSEIEESLDQSAQDLGLTDTVDQALGQAQEAQGVQNTVGGVAQQAQQAAGYQQEDEAQEEEPNATEAAKQKAQELGVELSQVEGSGSEGRVTVKDVQSVAN